ncbi:MAG: thiamine phosphate synthase [Pirellulales bacterium]
MEASDRPDQPDQIALLRILDAAANRASEGLRVVEDYVRFSLDDVHLTGICKQMRHELADAIRRIDPAARHAARDTAGDVGTRISTPQEQNRADVQSVAVASLHRLGQSLRTLEEYGKVLDAETGSRFERLRYDSYTLQRAITITQSSLARLADARLYALIDGGADRDSFAGMVSTLCGAGVHIVQLREKSLTDRGLMDRARLMREITRDAGVLMIVNDRPDIARLSHADGVHVGQEELTVKDARAVMGAAPLVGVSTHSIEQARQAVLDGASYIGVGPTFPSRTKAFESFVGLPLLAAVAAEIRLPAFAIGGIAPENLPQVLETGIHGVVVGTALTKADDPAAVARSMLAMFQARGSEPRAAQNESARDT